YSMLLSYTSSKYYKTPLLWSLNIAKHFAFFEVLMEPSIAVDSLEAFTEIEVLFTRTLMSIKVDHRLEENRNSRDRAQSERRHRSYQACAVFKVKLRNFTNYYSPGCSNGNKVVWPSTRKYLCNVRRDGRDTCFRVWYPEWKNGEEMPPPRAQPTRQDTRAGG
ncbi:hypothetical protein PHMEG_00024937, partial [Phytophthora megakarya]